MRKLPTEKRVAVLTALVEGMGVNATARMTGTAKVTVLRLLVDAASLCRRYHDQYVQKLATERLQLDEVWAFVGCKQRTKMAGLSEAHGDAWLWVAVDADSRLIVAYHVGGHNEHDARRFLDDTARRTLGRIQVTTDALKLYLPLVPEAFGDRVDYAVLSKHYGKDKSPDRTAAARYSPAECVGMTRDAILGEPDMHHCSTSYVERSHLTLRTHNRRFVRLGIGYSKRLLNHESAIDLHVFCVNWVRKHGTLKTSPAVAAGIARKQMAIADLVDMIEREESYLKGRITDYLPAA